MRHLKMKQTEYDKLQKNALRNIAQGEFTPEQATVILELQKDAAKLKAKIAKLEKRVATIDKRTQRLWAKQFQKEMKEGTYKA